MSTFLRETLIHKTRRGKTCNGCGREILIGFPSVVCVGIEDGFYNLRFHPECREAEIAYNNLIDSYPDEWEALYNIQSEDHVWLVEKFPIVAERLNIITEATAILTLLEKAKER